MTFQQWVYLFLYGTCQCPDSRTSLAIGRYHKSGVASLRIYTNAINFRNAFNLCKGIANEVVTTICHYTMTLAIAV